MKKKIIFLSLIFSLLIVVLIPLSAYYYISLQSPEKIRLLKSLLPIGLKSLVKEKVCVYKYYEPDPLMSYYLENERIFPQSQFLKLNYYETAVEGLKSRESYFDDIIRDGQNVVPFYIETFGDKNILISIGGVTLYYETSSFFKNKSSKNFEIKNNLPKNITIDDSIVYRDQIFISFRNRSKSCGNRAIYVADVNFDLLNFKEFYSHGSASKCKFPYTGGGGRMALYDDNGNPSIIISTHVSNNENDILLENNNKVLKMINSQKKDAIILLIDLKTKESRPFSSGHRNPQGLFVNEKNIIISTDHGPRGGDEINKIIEGNNYGWPSVSYGEDCFLHINCGENFVSNHSKNGFTEPIYAFVPSIAISQIIQVSEEFSSRWQDSYLITSLRGLSIYRVVFDENYSRIIIAEKMIIGKRIRDIAYNKKYNSFILALENGSGSVGIISVN